MLEQIFGATQEEVELFFDKNFPKNFDSELSFPLKGGANAISFLASMHLNTDMEAVTLIYADVGTIHWYGRESCTRCYFSDFLHPALVEGMKLSQQGGVISSAVPADLKQSKTNSFWTKLLPFSLAR